MRENRFEKRAESNKRTSSNRWRPRGEELGARLWLRGMRWRQKERSKRMGREIKLSHGEGAGWEKEKE